MDSHTTTTNMLHLMRTMNMLYLIRFCTKYNYGDHVINVMMRSETSSFGVLQFFHPSCYAQVMIFFLLLLCITNQLDFVPMGILDKQGISLGCPLLYNTWKNTCYKNTIAMKINTCLQHKNIL